MELKERSGKWFWQEGYATSQDFDTKEMAEKKKAEEDRICKDEGVDCAGILEWEY